MPGIAVATTCPRKDVFNDLRIVPAATRPDALQAAPGHDLGDCLSRQK